MKCGSLGWKWTLETIQSISWNLGDDSSVSVWDDDCVRGFKLKLFPTHLPFHLPQFRLFFKKYSLNFLLFPGLSRAQRFRSKRSIACLPFPSTLHCFPKSPFFWFIKISKCHSFLFLPEDQNHFEQGSAVTICSSGRPQSSSGSPKRDLPGGHAFLSPPIPEPSSISKEREMDAPYKDDKEDQQAPNSPAVGWTGMIEQQYRRIKENAEAYPYVWVPTLLCTGGLASGLPTDLGSSAGQRTEFELFKIGSVILSNRRSQQALWQLKRLHHPRLLIKAANSMHRLL
ncbi:hypothetical protein RHMOL_Rhmol08G0217300 [Rhododendron molle]|uniref:Uncharacterized protein n=1 Tax=Rhododendron molle TaxID=49168 RepID=A0ACC0MQX1_RHOML|nr:hypothetical protein RHMOL_Rhmol08G0217300 [Rhododendron molle]